MYTFLLLWYLASFALALENRLNLRAKRMIPLRALRLCVEVLDFDFQPNRIFDIKLYFFTTFSTCAYKTGRIIKTMGVETISPPMSTIAMGC